MTIEKTSTATPEDVRELVARVEVLREQLAKRANWRGHLDVARDVLNGVADYLARPASATHFTYTLTALVELKVRLSDQTKDDFEEWLSKNDVKYVGGGGDGANGEWTMNYYFNDERALGKATAWMRERGAVSKTNAELDAERAAKQKAWVEEAMQAQTCLAR